MDAEPTWGDSDMPDALEPATLPEVVEVDEGPSEEPREELQEACRDGPNNGEIAQYIETKIDPMDPRYHIVKRLDICGRPIPLEAIQQIPNWYNKLHRKGRMQIGFWNAQMVPPVPLKVKDAKENQLDKYKYLFFASRPFIPKARTCKLTLDEIPEDHVEPSDVQNLAQALYEYTRTGQLCPPHVNVEELVDKVDIALAQMSRQHDKSIETAIRYDFATPKGNVLRWEQPLLSPYAGPAPAPGEIGYLGRVSETKPVPHPFVLGAGATVQHVMNVLESSALVVDPNSSRRKIGANYEDTPLPRATPVYFPFSQTPMDGFPESAELGRNLNLAPSWVSSRFLAPDRNPQGPRGLGPYFTHHGDRHDRGNIFVEVTDGPRFLDNDEILAARYPPDAPPRHRTTVARRARAKTDSSNYTRRRAPAKKIKTEDTVGGEGRGRGAGRARGSGGRARGGRRGGGRRAT